MNSEYFDVVIVGAGLSGVGAACRLQTECPGKNYAVLEARETMGGTWDLFRYPGIRSDSDMHTLGYDFKPWRDSKAIADGPAILKYIRETAAEHGIDEHIRYRHKLVSASWSGDAAEWTLGVRRGGSNEAIEIRCNMLLMCAGYYDYDHGYLPEFNGRDRFRGQIVHPQHWPENFDYQGKQVVVIGSGATAMTLVPEMAKDVAHIVMLQRSPTYVISRPDKDIIANFLRKVLPEKTAYAITRWKNIRFQQWLYRKSRTKPEWLNKKLIDAARKALPEGYDVETHFTPRYDAWDQRLCLVPNSDLFEAINSGKASVVTAEIESFTEKGVLLKNGDELEADIIITATGLNLVVLGSVKFVVDGQPVIFPETFMYKGVMCSNLPNMVTTFGYINASWTLRADLIAEFFCRLVNRLDELGARQVTPRLQRDELDMIRRPWVEEFSSGYIQRVLDKLPSQGDHEPWRNPQNYYKDRKMLREETLDDGVLEFDHR